ncbi:serine threonine kinase [Fusarium longipes]|uniref:Serine threonine kinase n=1 Tax=Fusarium longipes TaxID=694270 RepID=A0A395SJ95_9HYPO|nr:serine threonine kinase [Fusarium longipes]
MPDRKHELDDDTVSSVSAMEALKISATPPILEIISADEVWRFPGPDDDFEPHFECMEVIVRMDTGDHFLVQVHERISSQDILNLDLSLLDLTSVAMEDIPHAFASFLANQLGIEIESTKSITVSKSDVCPTFSSSLTAAPAGMIKYCYLKYAQLAAYEPGNTIIKERVLAEANVCEVLMKNPHPNIMKYWGCYVVDGRIEALCLAKYTMTLAERVDTGVPLDTERCLTGIRDGIQHLHSLGLVHNDINSRNIMMDPADNPVIIDFDSCTREGEKMVKGWTLGWCIKDSMTGERENDFYGLIKLEEYLAAPESCMCCRE